MKKTISGQNTLDFILKSLSTGFGGMMFESEEEHSNRKVANTEEKDWTVDTCFATDTGFYETGITHKNIDDGNWVIVEEYSDKDEAKKGHKKWVKKMKTNPKKLWSIQTESWVK